MPGINNIMKMLFYVREEFGEREFFYLHDVAKEECHNTILALVEKGVRLLENTVIQMVLNAFKDVIPSDYDSLIIP